MMSTIMDPDSGIRRQNDSGLTRYIGEWSGETGKAAFIVYSVLFVNIAVTKIGILFATANDSLPASEGVIYLVNLPYLFD